MKDPPSVDVAQASQQLELEQPDVVRGQASWVLLHVLGQVRLHVFEDKGERVRGLHDVMEQNHVVMFEFFEQRRLSHRRERNPLLLRGPDHLQGHQLPVNPADPFVDLSVGSFSQFFQTQIRVSCAELEPGSPEQVWGVESERITVAASSLDPRSSQLQTVEPARVWTRLEQDQD